MRIGYLECFAGISGDMCMAALVDAGAPFAVLDEAARSLGLGAELRLSRVDRSGIYATKVDVIVDGRLAEAAAPTGPRQGHTHQHTHQKTSQKTNQKTSQHTVQDMKQEGHTHSHSHSLDHADGHHGHGAPSQAHGHSPAEKHSHAHGRDLAEVRDILSRATLPDDASRLAVTAFEMLAQAEARIHGTTVDQVHFHEVGAVDAIVDIACSAVALVALDVDGWYCSPVNVGSGYVDCAHGRFPVPAPATAELLRGMPTYSAAAEMELVTPTGAALLRALGCSFAALPVWRSDVIGYGAGTRNPARFPNVLRVTLGEVAADQVEEHRLDQAEKDTVTVLECALDDLTPEVLAHAAQLMLEQGALDVMRSPVTMKKGRLGTLLTVLCRPVDAPRLQEMLFRHTSTLGMRIRQERRVVLTRDSVRVQTAFGPVRIKTGAWRGAEMNAAPEFEDCRAAADYAGVPVKLVMEAALAAYREFHTAAQPQSAGSEA